MSQLINDYGFKHIYPDDKFYKVHKISHKDLLNKLKKA